MRKSTNTNKNKNSKQTAQLILGFSLAIFGIALIVAGFCCPPLAEISPSVLTAIGEVFTFSGSLIGIDYTYKYKMAKLEE